MTDFIVSEPSTGAADGTVAFQVHVPPELRYFEGHFRGDPVVPGVAQLVLVERAARRAFPRLGPVVAVKRVKFTQRIEPGANLGLELARRSGSGEARVDFTVRRGTELVSRGALIFG